MEFYQTEDHFTYLIFPFKTTKTFKDVESIRFQKSNGKLHPIWERNPLKINKPQEDFRLLFDMDNERRNIVKQYRFNPNLNKDFGVNRCYAVQTKEEKTGVEIEGFNLFFFETGIGFFTAKVKYHTQNTERILELNYLLSDVKRKESRLICESDEGEEATTIVEFVQKTLADYLPIFDFDERNGLDYVDRKPLIFSYYLLQNKIDTDLLGQLLFDARSNYRSAYKAPSAETSLKSSNNLQNFENSYWGVSINGAANISFKTDDERTNRFFEGEFIQRLQGIYLAMYLNVLNRYFTLKELRSKYLDLDGAVIYTKEQDFKAEVDKSKINKKLIKRLEKQEMKLLNEYCDSVKQLNNYATVFTLKNSNLLPSNVEHVNAVYKLMNDVYNIEGSTKQLSKDISSAKEIGDSYVRRIGLLSNAVRELKKVKSELFIYCILTVLGFLSTFHDLVGIVTFFMGTEILNTVYMWIPGVIIIIPIGVLCFKIVESTREYFEKKKELEELILQ